MTPKPDTAHSALPAAFFSFPSLLHGIGEDWRNIKQKSQVPIRTIYSNSNEIREWTITTNRRVY